MTVRGRTRRQTELLVCGAWYTGWYSRFTRAEDFPESAAEAIKSMLSGNNDDESEDIPTVDEDGEELTPFERRLMAWAATAERPGEGRS